MLDKYVVYLDESGDLGWKFDKPFQKGGSSRFFTIAGVIVLEEDMHRPERVMKSFRQYLAKKQNRQIPVSEEIKSTNLNGDEKSKFTEYLLREVEKAKFFKIFSITVRKEAVTSSIFKEDTNTLYNYMTKLGILESLAETSKITLIADQRITSTGEVYAFDSYLKTELAGTYNSSSHLEVHHKSSHSCRNIQCADIVTNLIWRSHEFQSDEYLEKFKHIVIPKKLFF